MIQLRVASDACRLSRIVGSATLTIVVSSSAMNMPTMSTMSAFQALRGTFGGVHACAVVSVMGAGPLVGNDRGKFVEQRPVPVQLGPQPLRLVPHHELLADGQELLGKPVVRL